MNFRLDEIIDYKLLETMELPDILRYYYENIENESFLYQIDSLKNELYGFKPGNDVEEYLKYLFLGLINYFEGNESTALKYFNIANRRNYFSLGRLIAYLEHKINRFRKLLIITSVSYEANNNYFDIIRMSKRVDLQMVNKRFNIKHFYKSLNNYDQVFMVGHGNDDYIRIGDSILTESHFIEHIEKGGRFPSVLGILSCKNVLKSEDVLKRTEYYIVDEDTSAQVFSEFFLFGYIKNFIRTRSVEDSYKHGMISLLFRSRLKPSFEIYLRGQKL